MPSSEKQNRRQRPRISISVGRRPATQEEAARIAAAMDRLIGAMVQQHLDAVAAASRKTQGRSNHRG